MAPISKKRAAMELQSYHPLVSSMNLNGYSSDSSNQGNSETSNSSSNNLNSSMSTNNSLNLHESSLQLSALTSLSALGLAAQQPHLNALHSLNHSQLLSNLSNLNGLSTASSSSTTSNNNEIATMGKQYAKVNRVVLDKNSDEYRRRRERNNLAVKKSRTKSKLKTLQTLERVKQLKIENDQLLTRIEILTKELRLLKDLFVMHASRAHNTDISDFDLSVLTNTDLSSELNLSLNTKFSRLFTTSN